MKIVFAQKEDYYNAIYLSVYFDGKEITLNKNVHPNVSLNLETMSLNTSGPYIVEFLKENNDLIIRLNTNLEIGENNLFLPWVLNAKFLLFKDKTGNILGKIDIGELRLCNEDKTCEPNENYFCSIDCKSANNPHYPFSQKIVLQPLVEKRGTFKYPLPQNVFYNIFLYSIFGLFIIFIMILIVYLKKK